MTSGVPTTGPLNSSLAGVGSIAWAGALVVAFAGGELSSGSHAVRLVAVLSVGLVLVGLGFRVASHMEAFAARPGTCDRPTEVARGDD